jgi:hypothetical protein
VDEDKEEIVVEGKPQIMVDKKPHKEKREEAAEKEKELGQQPTIDKILKNTRGSRNQSDINPPVVREIPLRTSK